MQLALWNDADPAEPSGVHVVSRARGTAEPQRRGEAAELRSSPASKLAMGSLERLEERAARYAEDAHAQNTRRAYRKDWAAFEAWCSRAGKGALPASTQTLELYLTHLAQRGLRVSTIRRARIAIGLAHAHAGVPRPDHDVRIRTLERGIGRTHGAHEEGAPPLLDHDLAQAVKGLGRSPRDERDRAMLLLGFAAALRAGELAGLNLPDVTFDAAGLVVAVRRSKEDQLGKGQHTRVPFGQVEATCPVHALRTWIGRVGRPSGPLFRVVQGGTIEHQRISERCVSRAVQRAIAHAGLPGHYSAHSLRAGLATSAYVHGATPREIQVQGRWKDPRSVHRYIRLEHVPGRRNVVDGLL